jgi:serine/threonine protein kinase
LNDRLVSRLTPLDGVNYLRLERGHGMVGRQIAHYEILEQLGEGGMGVVYKARDTHLDRFVAIKLLSPSVTADELRLARFVREAKTASALNHSNIVTIHDTGTDQGVMFIAMEYVHGRTLDAVIGRRGLPVKEAVHYAIEIAEALSAAHSAGIVHRDLKPANVMVTEQRHVKVLDFGLAKLRESAATAEDEPTRTLGPRTDEGAIVGTVAYMSPEQAQGGVVDARSDLFAFGAMLYEMLTGRKAFRGTTPISLLAAILKEEPERLDTVITGIPSELERIVTRCLRKDPARRFQNAADLKVALQEVLEEDERTPAVRQTARSNWRWLAPTLLLAVLGAGAGLVWLSRRDSAASPLLVLRRVTSDSGLTTDPSLSPNGTLVAYASDRSGEGNLDIWVQPVGGGEAVRLTRHETDDHQPAFSPDGARIAFRSDREGGGIYIMPALGGEPRLVVRNASLPRFSPDGAYILYSPGGSILGELHFVPLAGGQPRRLQEQHWSARDGVWAPDSKHVLFLGLTAPPGLKRGEWYITTLDGAAPVLTGARDVIDRYGLLPPGGQDISPSLWLERDNQVVFSARLGDSNDLWSISLSPGTGKVAGVPRRLTASTGLILSASFAAAPSTGARRGLGILALANLNDNVDLWSVPLDPNRGVSKGEAKRLTEDPAPDINVSVSRDGARAIFISRRSGGEHVWMKDLNSGAETQLTAGNTLNWTPHISPRGDRVAYGRREGEKWSLYAISLDARGRAGAEQRLCEQCGFPWSWSTGVNRLLYCILPEARIGLLDIGSGFHGEVLRHPKFGLWQGEFSPDDEWVAFQASSGGRNARIYVVRAEELRRSPAPESWIAITDDETWNDKPRWSPDGNLLYYVSERDGFRCLWVQRLDARTKRPSGPPLEVRHFHSSRLSLGKVNIGSLEISIAVDKVLVNAGEVKGNIWVAEILDNR